MQAADREVGFTRAEGRDLFALLATSKDGVRQDLVIEHLWPGQGEHGSQHLETGVRDINAAMRSATGLSTGVRFVIKTGQCRHLASAFFDIDLWRFEQAHLVANTAPGEDTRVQALRQMVAIHEGPLLAERDDLWCLPLRQAAARKATNAVMRLAELEHKTDPDHALDLLTLAVDRIDPYSEVLWCRIMTIHGELGRLPAVRAAFQQFTERLREVDAEPSRQARQIYRGLAG
uniref:AfsR/SARP family transcriptional regulator n=1 Tax=Microbispora cellulosiformans TaxID=2614688 RepID=UPI00177F5191|nr:bacterial transcriptional activator domain-containing protein [Microbispora cellulosiformans]